MSAMMRPPMAPRGFRRQKRVNPRHQVGPRQLGMAGGSVPAATWSAMADPGIEKSVEHVDREVRQDHDDGDEHHEILDHRVITPQDGLDQESRDPWEVEHGLRHDEAADQEREFDADHRDDGQHRIAERVAPHHDAWSLSLGPRRADVVLAEYLQDRGS